MCGKISSRAKSAVPKCSHKSRDGTFECVGLRFLSPNPAEPYLPIPSLLATTWFFCTDVFLLRICFEEGKGFFVVAVSVVGGIA